MDEKRLQRLTVIYGIALALIALTIISSSFIMQYAIQRNAGDSRIINLSGRQRMLSQRLTKCVLAIEHMPDGEEKSKRIKEISESFASWKTAHMGLQIGNEKLGLPVRQNSAEIMALFTEIKPFHIAMLNSLEDMLSQMKAGRSVPDTVHASADVMLRNEPYFLELMDKITFQFDREAKERIGSMQALERVILVVGLMVLLLEFLVVFRPSISQIAVMLTSLQKQAGQLREASEQLQNLFINAPVGIFHSTREGRFLSVNPALAAMLGYSSPEELLSTISDVSTQIYADRERRKQVMDALMKTDGWVHYDEVIWLRKDHSFITVDLTGRKVLDATGGIAYLEGFVEDITERKRMEEIQTFLAQTGLGAKEEPFFNALARYLAQKLCMDFICIDRLEGDGLTARTVAVWCDGHFEDNVTYALKDTPCGDVVGKDICCFPANVCQFFPRDQVLRELRAESYVGVTLFDHSGHPIGLIAVIGRSPMANRQLAETMLKMVALRAAGELERLEAMEALLTSEKRYATALAAVNDGLWDWHIPSGNAFFSDMYYALLGYKAGEFSATFDAWRLLVHPEDIDRVERDIQKTVETGIGFAIDLRMKGKNGEWIWVSTRGKTIELDADGRALRMVGTLSDITERKRAEADKVKLEEQNRQLQKAESLDRMAGAISHHFNNQLHVVMGYLGMAINDLPTSDSNVEKLTNAMQAAKRASEVSGLLLAYLGQIQSKIEFLDLAELCRMSLPILQAGMPKDVVMETDLPFPGPIVNADAKQIQQLLTNLIINAWESIGDRTGTIRLCVRTASSADISAAHCFPIEWRAKEKNYACLEVMDSGCGIQEKDMEKIFDPFFSTKFTGRGLGLSVALGIVRAHNSCITVQNGINGGSVFRVFFPISAQTASHRDGAAAITPQPVLKCTVLLVEDEEGVRKMTEIMLVKSGFKVLQAKDGVEALEIFGKHKDEISCLLCDLTMPRMDGWETISAARALRRDLPVILASGYDEASVMAGDHSELPDFFLNKPYNLNKLGDIIGQAIARRREYLSSK